MRISANAYVFAIALTTYLAPVCAAKPKQPIFVDPEFRFEEVDAIYILPAVDLRPSVDQAKDHDAEKHLLLVDWAGRYYLERRGYSVVPEVEKGAMKRNSFQHFQKQREDQARSNQPAPPARLEVTEDDLKEPSESWIRKLGPENARWVLILALEDSTSHLTFGSTGSAIVMGTLFDKQKGKLVWRAIDTGRAGQGGLLGMAMKSAMTEVAIEDAVIALDSMVEKRDSKKRK
jgi:hypothetical protein